MPTHAEKAATFRALHEGEPFVIPNAWDAGSARVLEGLGFRAIATTSSGFAFTLGRRDGDRAVEEGAAVQGAHGRTPIVTVGDSTNPNREMERIAGLTTRE